jgi:hypothetical protein
MLKHHNRLHNAMAIDEAYQTNFPCAANGGMGNANRIKNSF